MRSNREYDSLEENGCQRSEHLAAYRFFRRWELRISERFRGHDSLHTLFDYIRKMVQIFHDAHVESAANKH